MPTIPDPPWIRDTIKNGYVRDDSQDVSEDYATEWHKRYIAQLQSRGLTETFAKATLEAGMGHYDYTDCPEDAADEELSCWGGD